VRTIEEESEIDGQGKGQAFSGTERPLEEEKEIALCLFV
jgi:hypothetical protein